MRTIWAHWACHHQHTYIPTTTIPCQDVVLDMSSNASVRGGRTRTLGEGNVFGAIAFFTGAEQMEVRAHDGAQHSRVHCKRGGWWRCHCCCCRRHHQTCCLPTPVSLHQTVCTLDVVRVLAIHRSDYESIAERFQDSSRAVLENLLHYAQQASQLLPWWGGRGQRRRHACGRLHACFGRPVCTNRRTPQSTYRWCCTGTAPQPWQVTDDEFPGVGGEQVLSQMLASDAASKLQYHGTRPQSRAPPGSADPPCRSGSGVLPPPRLTARQQQAVGALLRVQALVSHFVARHDEERVQVGGWVGGRLNQGVSQMMDIMHAVVMLAVVSAPCCPCLPAPVHSHPPFC